jgi:hypothetical protein
MNASQPKSAGEFDLLRQVLELIDMFEDENMRMAADTIHINPALDMRRVSGPADLVDKITAEGHMHVAMMHAARTIGEAIRERFGLPPKKD